MRITDLKVYARHSPEHRARVSLVKVETDAGVAGWGSVSLSGALPLLTTSPKTRWRRPDGAVQDW